MPNPSIAKEIISWTKTIGLALLLALFINNFIIVNATVPTGSMEETIMPDDRIVALRLYYLFTEPKQGDIVVFKYPDDPLQKTLYVKRVIGTPGDTVEVVDGKVFLNDSDKPLADEYVNGVPIGSYGPYTVPENSYFMMGDNRNSSLDSRFWENTYVKKDKILGKVVFRYFPSPKIVR